MAETVTDDRPGVRFLVAVGDRGSLGQVGPFTYVVAVRVAERLRAKGTRAVVKEWCK